MSERGGRGSEFGYGGSGCGGLKKGGKDLRRGRVVISEEESGDDDEEEEEEEEGDDRLMKSFRDLISEEYSEEEDEDDGGGGGDVLKNASGLFPAKREASPLVVPGSLGRSDSYLSETRFDQCSVSSSSLKGIKDAGYEHMTVVQEATLPVILKGKDVLAKAKTGTGKTVAFLLPSIEVVLKSPPIDRDQKRSPIFVLIICPTRELASQATAEANTLLKYHPSIGVQVVIGGRDFLWSRNGCQQILARICNSGHGGVKVPVLDEADHLLDMGFRGDIEHIIAAVPKQRQTLLFSAIVPEEVRQICHIALKRDHEFIDTIGQGTEETLTGRVRQMHLVAPLDKHFSLLYSLLKEHISDDVDYKVECRPKASSVKYIHQSSCILHNCNGHKACCRPPWRAKSERTREIHSRKPQSYRTRISDEFRKSKGLILVTSDVSARGVDYPDVTLVIQVGLPADRQQYVHRLGRTGRKGKEGQGILLLAPWEEFFLSSIKDLPITKASLPLVDPEMRKKILPDAFARALSLSLVCVFFQWKSVQEGSLSQLMIPWPKEMKNLGLVMVKRALSHVEMKNKEAAYQAWLGYYNSSKVVRRDKYKLVELANEFSRSMGLDNPPAIPKLVLGKWALRTFPVCVLNSFSAILGDFMFLINVAVCRP
ncbi:P-loop containing nucleoside triphosphate hydrolases superfamily protein [Actinidia rufa]|uniref:ATP-dependent RNA helicase n=1 Tax=Actinidia rufa TaxID=165716 RepID=A0A7J0FG53_9ERIC|nr:P-loop containing nucleoside triphosphate hydrolases superfamily protein [Actinidia rufa]